MNGTPRTLLILSQVYVPDPASVGQHMADVAAEMVRRGWRVIVLTSRNGYDDPVVSYSRRETRDGVDIRRLRWCSFGKQSIAIRLVGGLSFVLQAIWSSLWLGTIEVVLVSTSPPMASIAALMVGRAKGALLKYWVMDLNPDQIVALGRLKRRALAVRLFDWLNRLILAAATDVIVLDRFMATRVNAKHDVSNRLSIIPPWPLDDYLEPVPHAVNPFRSAHELDGKVVVMYSGNHGPSNPFHTVLEAAARLQHETRLVFMFIGGGVGKREVESLGLPNIRSLPYQPLETLRFSLSAADIHLVTLGDEMVGIVHPCKVYGAMAVGRAVLLLGPAQSHIGDLLEREPIGWMFRHGDVDGVVQFLLEFIRIPSEERKRYGVRARAMITTRLSKDLLCNCFCDVVERRS